MEINKLCGGLLKRFAAASAGLVMVLGGTASPILSCMDTGSTLTAYAEEAEETTENVPDPLNGWTLGTFKSGGHEFSYATKKLYITRVGDNTEEAFMLLDVKVGDRSLSIPSTVTIDGVTHTVNALYHGFGQGIKAENVTIPDTVSDIGNDVFRDATISSLNVPGSVQNIGENFCRDVSGLNVNRCSVDTSSLKNIKRGGFAGTAFDVPNKNGAVILDTCLLRYTGPDVKEIKIADLADTPIEIIGGDCFAQQPEHSFNLSIQTMDISGVRALSTAATNHCGYMSNLIGTDDLRNVDWISILLSTWFQYHKNDDKVILGDCVFKYKAGEVLDFTADEFKYVTKASQYAFTDLENVKVMKLRDNESILDNFFTDDPYHLKNLEEVYIGGKKVECTKAEQFMPGLIKRYYKRIFQRSKFCKTFTDNKTRLVFNELGIDYYGPYNDKVGTLSAKDEFYIVKTLHDYLARDYGRNNGGADTIYEILNIGTDAVCQPYSELYAYMLECAGVDAEVLKSGKLVPAEGYTEPDEGKYSGKYKNDKGEEYVLIDLHCHAWNIVKVGGNWYHIDISWDSLTCDWNSDHTYGWFMFTEDFINDENMKRAENGIEEVYQGRWVPMGFINTDPYYFYSGMSIFDKVAVDAPYYADVNGDHVRTEDDWLLAQGVSLLSDDIKEKLLNDEELSADDKAQIAGIKIIRNEDKGKNEDEIVPIRMIDDKGNLTFNVKQCDADFDGTVDMHDVLTIRQICSGKCSDPIKELNENADRSEEEYDLCDHKLELFEAGNGEGRLDLEQPLDADLTVDLGDYYVKTLSRQKPAPLPQPVPAPTPAPPKSSSSSAADSRTESKAENSKAPADTKSSSKAETVTSAPAGMTEDSGSRPETDTKKDNSDIKDTDSKPSSEKSDPLTIKPDYDKADDTVITDGETTDQQDKPKLSKGDMDGDGKISVTDIAMVASHLKGIHPLTADQLKAADINGDGDVNVSDIAAMAAHIKGIKAIG